MEKETPHIAKQRLREIEQQCLGLLTRQVARRVTQWYDHCQQANGLRSTQFNSRATCLYSAHYGIGAALAKEIKAKITLSNVS